jgi:heme-degrading monooxygenase HmoA
MVIQVVNFRLQGLDETDYEAACEELAPTFKDVPGLISKVWLKNSETNTYGGIYTWVDRAALEAYKASDLFAMIRTHPHFGGASSNEFDVLEEPTRITRGFASVTAAAR